MNILPAIAESRKRLTARVKHHVKRLFGQKKAGAPVAAPELPLRRKQRPVHLVRFRPSNGEPIKGPAFVPAAEYHHASRQTCRAMLRALMFDRVTKLKPDWSRRDRRRQALLAARVEYNRMMLDETNAIAEAERRKLSA